MKSARSLFDVINGIEKKPAKAKYRKVNFKPIPLGHLLAVNIYKEGIYQDVLFVDHIDVCDSHTVLHYNDRLMEAYPVRRSHSVRGRYSDWVFYENNTEFEIIRIN